MYHQACMDMVISHKIRNTLIERWSFKIEQTLIVRQRQYKKW